MQAQGQEAGADCDQSDMAFRRDANDGEQEEDLQGMSAREGLQPRPPQMMRVFQPMSSSQLAQ